MSAAGFDKSSDPNLDRFNHIAAELNALSPSTKQTLNLEGNTNQKLETALAALITVAATPDNNLSHRSFTLLKASEILNEISEIGLQSSAKEKTETNKKESDETSFVQSSVETCRQIINSNTKVTDEGLLKEVRGEIAELFPEGAQFDPANFHEKLYALSNILNKLPENLLKKLNNSPDTDDVINRCRQQSRDFVHLLFHTDHMEAFKKATIAEPLPANAVEWAMDSFEKGISGKPNQKNALAAVQNFNAIKGSLHAQGALEAALLFAPQTIGPTEKEINPALQTLKMDMNGQLRSFAQKLASIDKDAANPADAITYRKSWDHLQKCLAMANKIVPNFDDRSVMKDTLTPDQCTDLVKRNEKMFKEKSNLDNLAEGIIKGHPDQLEEKINAYSTLEKLLQQDFEVIRKQIPPNIAMGLSFVSLPTVESLRSARKEHHEKLLASCTEQISKISDEGLRKHLTEALTKNGPPWSTLYRGYSTLFNLMLEPLKKTSGLSDNEWENACFHLERSFKDNPIESALRGLRGLLETKELSDPEKGRLIIHLANQTRNQLDQLEILNFIIESKNAAMLRAGYAEADVKSTKAVTTGATAAPSGLKQPIDLFKTLSDLFVSSLGLGERPNLSSEIAVQLSPARTPLMLFAGRLMTLPDKERPKALAALKESVTSILNGTYKAERYKGSDLAQITQNNTEFLKNWQKGESIHLEKLQSKSGVESKPQATIDVTAYLRQRISLDKHLSTEEYPYLDACLTGTTKEMEKLKKDTLSKITSNKLPQSAKYNPNNLKEASAFKAKMEIALVAILDPAKPDKKKAQEIAHMMPMLQTICGPNSPIVQDIMDLKNQLEDAWVSNTHFNVEDTDDWGSILQFETEVEKITEDPLNLRLLDNLADGRKRVIVTRDRNGNVVAGCIIRLQWDDQKKRAVIFQEKTHRAPGSPENVIAGIDAMVARRAISLGLEVVQAFPSKAATATTAMAESLEKEAPRLQSSTASTKSRKKEAPSLQSTDVAESVKKVKDKLSMPSGKLERILNFLQYCQEHPAEIRKNSNYQLDCFINDDKRYQKLYHEALQALESELKTGDKTSVFLLTEWAAGVIAAKRDNRKIEADVSVYNKQIGQMTKTVPYEINMKKLADVLDWPK